MLRCPPRPIRASWGFWLIGLLIMVGVVRASHAQETVCSVVRIEIRQELTLERQAFDAHMRITNGLDTTALEDIEINVWFLDADGNPVLASSDPENVDAVFFITQDETTGLSGGVNGNGTIGAGAQADIHWLIIPAPGAGGELPSGRLFQVGATLAYSYGGESETVEVAPDFIQVRPMPRLSLDYFLPDEVLGDDPLTPEEEAPVPFPLAVRVKNSGFGPAKNLAIESAQPEIVDNDQGLLINFELLNTQVNDGEVVNSLLAEFGDLPAGESATAIWSMLVSLYGHFVSFEADYYHSDSLGGELTSLIDRVDTHTLVGLVRNDLPGRDSRRDFLARPNGGDTLALFESNGSDTPAEDVSLQSVLELVEQSADQKIYELSFPARFGPVYSFTARSEQRRRRNHFGLAIRWQEFAAGQLLDPAVESRWQLGFAASSVRRQLDGRISDHLRCHRRQQSTARTRCGCRTIDCSRRVARSPVRGFRPGWRYFGFLG